MDVPRAVLHRERDPAQRLVQQDRPAGRETVPPELELEPPDVAGGGPGRVGDEGVEAPPQPVARLDRDLFAVREGVMKLILASDGEAELYDLGGDAREERKLALPEKEAALRALLAGRYAGAGVGFPGA